VKPCRQDAYHTLSRRFFKSNSFLFSREENFYHTHTLTDATFLLLLLFLEFYPTRKQHFSEEKKIDKRSGGDARIRHPSLSLPEPRGVRSKPDFWISAAFIWIFRKKKVNSSPKKGNQQHERRLQ